MEDGGEGLQPCCGGAGHGGGLEGGGVVDVDAGVEAVGDRVVVVHDVVEVVYSETAVCAGVASHAAAEVVVIGIGLLTAFTWEEGRFIEQEKEAGGASAEEEVFGVKFEDVITWRSIDVDSGSQLGGLVAEDV